MGSGQAFLILSLGIASVAADRATIDQAQVWVTEAEYQFGDAPNKGVFFSWPYVVADPERNRIFALDAANSQVSAWTPEGTLLFSVGRKGEGPGDFLSLGNLFVEADGTFSVQEASRSRFTYFTADGELTKAIQGPGMIVSYQGFGLELHRPNMDGVYLGVPQFPAALEVGTTEGVQPIYRQPIVRVRGSGDGDWNDPEPLLWLDRRNRIHAMRLPDGEVYGAQPFGDSDQVRFEPGKAVVMRLNDAPGAVELIEVSAEGDTIWHRYLHLKPRRLNPRMVEEAAEATLDMLTQEVPGTPRLRLWEIYEEGLYQPDFVPPVEGPPLLSSSGEIWLRTTERLDTLRIHYAVRRGSRSENPRRVLLPEWLWINDATETHIWGVMLDSLEVPQIVGRRLRPKRSR